MDWKKVTRWIILVAVVTLLGYDIFVVVHDSNATISNQVVVLSRQYLTIPFAAGFLMGHLFASFTAGGGA